MDSPAGGRGRQRGSSLGEQLILYAMGALLVTLLVIAYGHSPAYAFAMIGIGLATGALVMAFGLFRDRRAARRRVERCRSGLEAAAAAGRAALDASFFGAGQGGPAAFGVAGAARKLFHARDDVPKVVVKVLEFDELAAAFARQDGNRFRLEVRTRTGGDEPARAALFLTVDRRQEAERWIQALAPHLGARAKMVETKDEV